MEEIKTNSKDDFYAVVSALARFIETADDDVSPKPKSAEGSRNRADRGEDFESINKKM